ncbi:tol-pal system-associated acyl-CoA thioesterase [Devosia pacifica]|uniref:Tol-pal system-associated acyl-CoA thioesterase n=1 Tax=Devosia pacifica TaxID=1335967 RepID=A0A918SGN8_9HYPH|nr:tol-pal system-associated acyl-CoA thioesterase [Devosia pacifica]GHA37845.1 tol-pal system-associated acyl-CoA thioesterase [Devosia pacifica]
MHTFTVRIYYEDTDFSGNVYHAAYLKFLEQARTEWLRALGIGHAELAQTGLAFAVRDMQITFHKPAHIDDLLSVSTRLSEMRGARLLLDQNISRDGDVLTRASLSIVVIRLDTGSATRLPESLRSAINPA